MPAERVDYISRPFAAPRQLADARSIGQLLGLQGQQQRDAVLSGAALAQQRWQQLGQAFSNYATRAQAERREQQVAAMRAEQQRIEQEKAQREEQFKRDQLASIAADRLADNARQAEIAKAARTDKLANETLPGVIPPETADALRDSGRVRVLDGAPVLMRTPQQQQVADTFAASQAALKAAAERQASTDQRLTSQFEETKRHNQAMENRPTGGNASTDRGDATSIAQAIVRGEQPPEVTGLYRLAGPVRAELSKQGYDLAKANLDWKATQRHLTTLNGAQQTRLRQAIGTAYDSLDVIENLANQWKGGRFPILNKANLALAKNGAYGKDAASIATQLEGQITDVTSELANAYMGGNSPTDHALSLAAKNLSADWDANVLRDMVKLARTNLTIRRNSIEQAGPITASSQQQAAQGGGAQTPPPSMPDLSGLPAGRGRRFSEGPFAGQTWKMGANGPVRVQ